MASAPWVGKRLPNAKELAEFLPIWFKVADDTPSLAGYANLKTAAIEIARAPERERRNLISAYSWAYCEPIFGGVRMDSEGDAPRLSAMYLLLRVLFVVPTDHPISDVRVFGPWNRPPEPLKGGIIRWNLSYPVTTDPGGRVLRIAPPPVNLGFWGVWKSYFALDEYDYFSARFHRRSPAEIEALEVR